jgi:hypothetical protein
VGLSSWKPTPKKDPSHHALENLAGAFFLFLRELSWAALALKLRWISALNLCANFLTALDQKLR